ESMVRAIARQAEAERIRRAKIINAEGEQQAAEKLVEAAEIIARAPQAMQLRYLGTLSDIANERSATIVFPFPIDLVQELGDRLRTAPKRPDRSGLDDRVNCLGPAIADRHQTGRGDPPHRFRV